MGTGEAPARVWIVEDDAVIREVVTTALADAGYTIVSAPHGAAALTLLGQPERAPPDVILLDLRMPLMDGAAFVDEYRRLPGPHAPIIAVTGTPDAAARAAQVHADDVVTKPFVLDDLLARVEHFTRRPSA
jgi:two-component system nitrogen regulation response regulator GlnG